MMKREQSQSGLINYEMLAFEQKLAEQKFELIAGVDEVGRGPLAGPVVAAAVILPTATTALASLAGVNDSKKLSTKKRALYYEQILAVAISVGIGSASVAEIDELNILQATKLAMNRAVDHLNPAPDYLLIDYLTLDRNLPQMGIVKGDAKSLSIAAASIVAKETRDALMRDLGTLYPVYGFAKHAGYGTKQHREALANHGYVNGVHRQSFSPIKKML